jgi:hypothetical protein
MLRIIVSTITPFVLIAVTPLGITETTPFGEAVTIITLAIGGAIIGWWMNRPYKHD